MAILLMAALTVMLHFSRKAVKEEALQKATQTLEATTQRLDNMLLSTEQAAGNFYFSMMPYINQPEMIHLYCRKVVESNPMFDGCAIAFVPGYFNAGEDFIAYYHREDRGIVRLNNFANESYTRQRWFTKPMETGKPEWLNPLEDPHDNVESLITFALPIWGSHGRPIGVIGIDVSLELLTDIVHEGKPSPNSYCIMLDSLGTYMVHPDSTLLTRHTVFEQTDRIDDPSIKRAAIAMVARGTGYKPFRMNDTDYYIFYKPFKRTSIRGRSVENLGWSIGIIYPDDDIFGDYNDLIYYVFAIAIVGLLLMFILFRVYLHRRLLPLRMLTASAQRIAKGHYDEQIPDSHQEDEIGRLQDNFRLMQKTLSTSIGELEQATATMHKRGEELKEAYNQAQKADRMKIAFLNNMTNQMSGPAEAINDAVEQLCDGSAGSATAETRQLADDIQHNGDTIAELLKDLINISDDEKQLEKLNLTKGEGGES
jgi:HAMP domain-containing protein